MYKFQSFKKAGFFLSVLSFLVMLTPLFTFTSEISAAGALYTRDIVINATQVPSDNTSLTQFPVLVSLNNDSALANHANPSGNDIYFTDAIGNPLPYEIEQYTSGNLIAWIQVPSLSNNPDTPTTFKMLYGGSTQTSPGNVWSNSFQGVWHMDQTNPLDSSANGNNGTTVNGSITNVTGKIGEADSFVNNSPASGYVDCGKSSSLAFYNGGQYTWSAWINTTGALGGGCGIIGRTSGKTGTSGFDIYLQNSGNAITIQRAGGSGVPSVVASTDSTFLSSWHLITLTYSNQTVLIYLDGNLKTQTPGLLTGITDDINDNVYIGYRASHSNGTGIMNGYLDEVRWSNTQRSNSWIQAEFNNQSNPGNFYTLGSESRIQSGASLVPSSVSVDYGETASFTAVLTSSGSPVSGENIDFSLNGSNIGRAATDTNGIATLSAVSLNGLLPGAYPGYIEASFAGDTGYSSCNNNASLTINKITPVFSNLAPSQSITSGTSSVPLDGTLSKGTLIPSGNISATINGTSQTAFINPDNGSFNKEFPTALIPANLSPYTITYYYAGDAIFNGISDTSTTLTVSQPAAASTSVSVSPVTGNYTGPVTLRATLTSGGNGVGGQNINFTLNSVNAGSAVTDSNGATTLNLSLPTSINPGTYNSGVLASFAGNSSYVSSNSSASLTVNKGPVVISLSPVTGAYGGSVTLTATLTCYGQLVSVNQNFVTFTLNGETKGSTNTNSSGKATISNVSLSNLPAGFYSAGFGVNFAGSTKYAASSASNSLTINKIALDFSNLSSLTINQGTPSITVNGTLGNNIFYLEGEPVTITISGISQNATVGANGLFFSSFSAGGLDSGTYSIDYNYSGNNNFKSASGNSSLLIKTPILTSYSDPGLATRCTDFAFAVNHIYLQGTDFIPGDYRVAYYDGNGILKYSDNSVSVNATGILSTDYLLKSDKTAAPGRWHILIQPSSGFTDFGTSSYNVISTDPGAYSLLIDYSVNVASSAIPEFPSAGAALGVSVLCILALKWTSRRKRSYCEH